MVLKVDSNSSSKNRGCRNWRGRGRGGKPSYRGGGTGSGNPSITKTDYATNHNVVFFLVKCEQRSQKPSVSK